MFLYVHGYAFPGILDVWKWGLIKTFGIYIYNQYSNDKKIIRDMLGSKQTSKRLILYWTVIDFYLALFSVFLTFHVFNSFNQFNSATASQRCWWYQRTLPKLYADPVSTDRDKKPIYLKWKKSSFEQICFRINLSYKWLTYSCLAIKRSKLHFGQSSLLFCSSH